MSNEVVTGALMGALAVVYIAVSVISRRGNARFLPSGDPVGDRVKLEAWWTKEAARAGFVGAVEVTVAPVAAVAVEGSPLWKALVPGGIFFVESALRDAHVYTAKMPGPKHLVARVFTTDRGQISRVVFEAGLARVVDGEIVYRKQFVEIGRLFSGGGKFEGAGAAILNADRSILAAADAALTLSYVPPRGISSSLISKNAALTLVPAAGGSTLLVDTLPRPAGIGDILFGLTQVVALCRKLEPS